LNATNNEAYVRLSSLQTDRHSSLIHRFARRTSTNSPSLILLRTRIQLVDITVTQQPRLL